MVAYPAGAKPMRSVRASLQRGSLPILLWSVLLSFAIAPVAWASADVEAFVSYPR